MITETEYIRPDWAPVIEATSAFDKNGHPYLMFEGFRSDRVELCDHQVLVGKKFKDFWFDKFNAEIHFLSESDEHYVVGYHVRGFFIPYVWSTGELDRMFLDLTGRVIEECIIGKLNHPRYSDFLFISALSSFTIGFNVIDTVRTRKNDDGYCSLSNELDLIIGKVI